MKGLLMKDIILLRPQLKIYLIILVSDSHVERTAGIFRRAYGDVRIDDTNDDRRI